MLHLIRKQNCLKKTKISYPQIVDVRVLCFLLSKIKPDLLIQLILSFQNQQSLGNGMIQSLGFLYFIFLTFFLFNWDSLHARLNSHYETWSYKKKKHKKITAYRKSVQKEPTVKRCLLILDLKPLRSQIKGKHSIGRKFQTESSCARKENVEIGILVTSRIGDRKIMQCIRITSRSPSRKRKRKQLNQF